MARVHWFMAGGSRLTIKKKQAEVHNIATGLQLKT